MKQKCLSCFTALLVGLTLVPACGSYSDTSVVKAADQEITGTADGYDYELWNLDNKGIVDMQTGSNGAFSCSWNGIQNCLFRTGKKLDGYKKYQDYGNIAVNYDADYYVEYQPDMVTSHITVEGKGLNDHEGYVVYHIVEAWAGWRPPGSELNSLGTVNSDEKQYDIYQTIQYVQSIQGSYRILHYWSVQKNNPVQINQINSINGTITVTNHFQQWEKAGLSIDELYDYVSLNIESCRSNGKAEVKKNEMIIGADNPNGSVSTDPPAQTSPVVPGTDPVVSDTNTGNLKDAFAGSFKVGTSSNALELNISSNFIKKHFNSVTPQKELQPGAILPQFACIDYGCNINPQVAFGSNIQQIMKFCCDNGVAMRGSAFICNEQTPDWFFREKFRNDGPYVSKEVMDQRLENLIRNTFDLIQRQYPELDLYAYDVCNGLFDKYAGELLDSGWVKIYGDDSFVEKAFTYARKYAPSGCRLYLTDNNEYTPAKINAIYDMAMKLKDAGVIDGIGMESHLDVSYPDIFSAYEKAMKKYISTGLDVQVTDLEFTAESESVEEPLYKNIFRLCFENAAHISSLTVSRQGDSLFLEGPGSPSLFNSGSQDTEEYKAVMEYAKAVNNTTPVTTSLPVTTTGITTTAVTEPPVTSAITTNTVTTPPVSSDLKGDTDCSGSVTAADIVKMMQVMIGKTSLSAQGLKNADLNKDGILSIVDLILLKSSLL